MKITIESTEFVTLIDGVLCRVWRGVTESGMECDLAIPRLRVKSESDATRFATELFELPGPQLPAMDFAQPF